MIAFGDAFDYVEGKHVRILEGPFEQKTGRIVEILGDSDKVVVEVVLFGRPTKVDLERWQIELLD